MAISKEQMKDMYVKMRRIRDFESTAARLFAEGKIPGFVHLYLGEEAIAPAVCECLRDDDFITSTHRGHGHCIAKGAELDRALAELMGKATGYCKGRSGSMHIADFSKGNLGANAIVGGGIPIATGGGLAIKMQNRKNVSVAFFGDGASNQGTFHESINLAAVWKLPVIFVCENNLYSATTSISLTCLQENVAADRAAIYGIPSEVVDGNDVLAVNEAATRAIARARAGEGRTILELKTYRHGGHSRNDACGYRPKEEEAEWFAKDPVVLFRKKILEHGVITEEELQKEEAAIEQEIEDAVEYAKQAPFPANEDALINVFKEDDE